MSRKGLKVTAIEPDSIAEAIGIEVGDRLLTLNGREIKDLLDYRFLVGEETLLLEVAKGNNEVWELDIEKELDEDLGLETEEMKIRQCPNKCLFCFVDQMPAGQRDPLYIRDEDYRFSFLFGNYITLTNLSRRDKARIFEQKMSPLYVSVHTTDVALRQQLLENPKAKPILDEIEEMLSHQIAMHTQIVLCPDLNDGRYLTQSVRDLADRHPGVESLAIVPVGLTRHRADLPEVKTVDATYARNLIQEVMRWQEQFQAELGNPFVFAADEWYVIADRPFPPLETYGALQQLENGVGMVPLFRETFEKTDFSVPLRAESPIRFIVVTGTSFSPFLNTCLKKVTTENICFEVLTIINHFFGDSVTVAGLVTGGDIMDAVREWRTASPGVMRDVLLIPDVMLAETRHSFLDGSDPETLQEALHIPVHVVPADAEAFIAALPALATCPENSPLAHCAIDSGLGILK